jgi:AcrR family transcriptional regulator
MTASDRTKQLLAQSLKELAATKPLRKIQVGELCANCGVARRTFYYHFLDVYDLAAWVFDQTIHHNLPLRTGTPSEQGLIKVLRQFREEDEFYRCALAEDSQNALGRHFLTATAEMYTALILRYTGKEALTAEESFTVGYHCFGTLGMIRRWIMSEPERTPEEMAKLILLLMPPIIRSLYTQDQKRSEK